MYKIIEGRHVTLSKTCNLSCLNMNDNTKIILTYKSLTCLNEKYISKDQDILTLTKEGSRYFGIAKKCCGVNRIRTGYIIDDVFL